MPKMTRKRVTRVPETMKHAAARDMHRRVLDLLPLDGSPVRSQEVRKWAEKKGIVWRTALRHLREAEGPKEESVVTSAGIVKGRPAKFYASNVAKPYGRLLAKFQRILETVSAPPMGSKARTDSVRKSLPQFRDILSILVNSALLEAAAARTKAQAIGRAEREVDYVFRRFVSMLAGFAWDTRSDSFSVLAEAYPPFLSPADEYKLQMALFSDDVDRLQEVRDRLLGDNRLREDEAQVLSALANTFLEQARKLQGR